MSFWTMQQERNFLAEIIRQFDSKDFGGDVARLRTRHVDPEGFVRNYLRALKNRYLSFEGHGPLMESERYAMERHCRLLIEQIKAGEEEKNNNGAVDGEDTALRDVQVVN